MNQVKLTLLPIMTFLVLSLCSTHGACMGKPAALLNTEELFEKGYNLYLNNDYLGTVQNLSKIKIIRDQDLQIRVSFLLGKSYAMLGSKYKATRFLDKAGELDNNLLDIVFFEKASMYYRANNISAANKNYKSLLEHCPESPFIPQALIDMGDINYKHDNLSTAEKAYTYILEQYPKYRDADLGLVRLANIYEKTKRLPEAFALYTKVLYQFPDTAHRGVASMRIAALSSLVGKEARPAPEELLNAAINLNKKKQVQGKQ